MRLISRDGIVLRSLLTMLLAFLVAGIGALAYTSYTTAQRATRTIDTRLNQLLDTVQNTVKIACFLKDEELAKEVATGLLGNSEVLRVAILADGAILADASRPAASAEPKPSADRPAALERQIYSPFTPGKIVGLVTLEPNPEEIATQRRDEILLAVQQLAWQLLLVSGAIAAALIVFVARPISRISLALHALDAPAGDRLAMPPGHQTTEIGRLVMDINRLADRLVAALAAARQAHRAAEAASAAKSHFLADNSHEIRAPLAAMKDLARNGLRDSPDAASRETFSRILDAVTCLLDAINDILDFSEIEAGKLIIENHPFRPTDITSEAIALMSGRAAEKGLELTHRPSPDLPAWVMGDPLRIRQILVNLLANAIKFSRHGTVDLTVLRAEDEIWFAVRDEGVGMTAEEIARLFRPFEQAEGTARRKCGRTGLSLSISMNLASLMGGTIHVVSTPWRGSTFTLQLPLQEASLPLADEARNAAPFNPEGRLDGFPVLATETANGTPE